MSSFDVLNFNLPNREPLSINSAFFAVLFPPEFVSPFQVPTLGYYGKFGYKHSPGSVIELEEAVDIIYEITVTDVQKLLHSVGIKQETREKVIEALKRNTKQSTLVLLV